MINKIPHKDTKPKAVVKSKRIKFMKDSYDYGMGELINNALNKTGMTKNKTGSVKKLNKREIWLLYEAEQQRTISSADRKKMERSKSKWEEVLYIAQEYINYQWREEVEGK